MDRLTNERIAELACWTDVVEQNAIEVEQMAREIQELRNERLKIGCVESAIDAAYEGNVTEVQCLERIEESLGYNYKERKERRIRLLDDNGPTD